MYTFYVHVPGTGPSVLIKRDVIVLGVSLQWGSSLQMLSRVALKACSFIQGIEPKIWTLCTRPFSSQSHVTV